MKLNNSPRVGINNPDLQRELREHALQVNALSEGRIGGTYNAQSAAPTTGSFAQGDFVKNSAPTELGVALSKYVILGWVNVTGGEPGTFLPVRALTGN
jgi:hypothetical protein